MRAVDAALAQRATMPAVIEDALLRAIEAV